MDEIPNYRKIMYAAGIVSAMALSGFLGYSLKPNQEIQKPQQKEQKVVPKDISESSNKEANGSVEEILEKAQITVEDGDNIIYGGINRRLAAIDAPEIANSHQGWPDQHGTGQFKDINFGQKAKDCLTEIVKNGTDIRYISIGKELYGRDLGYLIVDGKLAEIILVEKGLAYENHSHFKNPTRSDLGDQVVGVYNRMYKDGEKPHFQEPYKFRADYKRRNKEKNGNKEKKPAPNDEKKKRRRERSFSHH